MPAPEPIDLPPSHPFRRAVACVQRNRTILLALPLVFCGPAAAARRSAGAGSRVALPDSGDLRWGSSWRTSSKSRPSASISASTPYSADRSRRPVSTVCAPYYLRRHGRERGQHHGADVPADPDQVQGGCRVHAAMVAGGQVTPHHRDPVTAGLARPAGRQQQQFPGTLHGRGAVTDLELGVDAADVRADGVRRDGQFVGRYRSTRSSPGLLQPRNWNTSLFQSQGGALIRCRSGSSWTSAVRLVRGPPFPLRALSARARPGRGRPAGAAARPGCARSLTRAPARTGCMPETPVACSAVSAPQSGAVFRASLPARPGGQHADRQDGTDHQEVVAEDRVQPHTLGDERTPWLASRTAAMMPVVAASTQTSA